MEINFRKEVTWSVTHVNMVKVTKKSKKYEKWEIEIWKIENQKPRYFMSLEMLFYLFNLQCSYSFRLLIRPEDSKEEKQVCITGSRSEDCNEMYHWYWKIKILKGQ